MERTHSLRPQRGFTLIELMIAIAVVGILMAIAYPSYTSAQIKNRRATAQAVLMDISQRQQQYLLDNRSYSDTVAALNVSVPTGVTSYYTVTIVRGTATVPSYVATAAPIAGTSQASDGNLTIASDGSRTPTAKW
ncbi:MAG TPA: type IV pilin protein [Ramlibacter sp.]|nr:type IV pilin protein [Ramlibacter sp.]